MEHIGFEPMPPVCNAGVLTANTNAPWGSWRVLRPLQPSPQLGASLFGFNYRGPSESRTHTPMKGSDFESDVSACSTIEPMLRHTGQLPEAPCYTGAMKL